MAQFSAHFSESFVRSQFWCRNWTLLDPFMTHNSGTTNRIWLVWTKFSCGDIVKLQLKFQPDPFILRWESQKGTLLDPFMTHNSGTTDRIYLVWTKFSCGQIVKLQLKFQPDPFVLRGEEEGEETNKTKTYSPLRAVGRQGAQKIDHEYSQTPTQFMDVAEKGARSIP